MNDFERILNANIDDLYLRDIGFVPSNYKKNAGACPLHGGQKKDKFTFIEKNGRRLYTCWSDGCIRGGDIIEVCKVKEHFAERIDAVKFLAQQYGIELNSYSKKDLSEEEKKALEEKQAKAQKKRNDLYKLQLAYNKALEMKNVEHALSLSFLEDKIKYNKSDEFIEEELEKVNYSNYIANNKYEVNKYLSECESGMINALLSANEGFTEAVFAPTGSGKTRLLANLLKKLKLKALIILPLQSNVEQFVSEYDWCDGAWGKRSIKKPFKNKSEIIVMTWDKAAQLAKDNEIDLSDYILVADEIHQTYIDIFRSEAISGFFRLCMKIKGRLDITATPNKLDFSIYDNITEYTQLIQTNYNVTIYNNTDTAKIINIANKSNKFAILMNDTKTLNYITDRVDKKCTVVYSDNKDFNPVYEEIMGKGSLNDIEGLCNTAVIVAGVNIYDLGITDVVIVGISDIATIKQYVARFRELESVNVHIFKSFEAKANIYLVESLIEQELEQAQILANTYTTLTKNHTSLNIVSDILIKDSLKAVGVGGLVYFNEDTQKYEVNEFAIRAKVYKTYYNSRTIEQFKILLEEYFNNISIYDASIETKEDKEITILIEKDKSEYKKYLEQKKLEALEFLYDHKDILVGYNDIIKNNFITTMDYYYVKGISLSELKNMYQTLEIQKIVTESKIVEIITRYSNYVLDLSFSNEVAWIVANMGNSSRGNFFKKVNTLVFRDLKFKYDNVINDALVENQLFDFITTELPPGTSYTEEHLNELIKDIKNKFGNNKEFTLTKIGTILRNIYVIKENRVSKEKLPQLEIIFYRNIKPDCSKIKSKQARFYTVKNFKTIEDIKKELAVTSSDSSIDSYVSKLTASHLDKCNVSTSQAKFIEVDFEDIF